jgi:hypothetical protein
MAEVLSPIIRDGSAYYPPAYLRQQAQRLARHHKGRLVRWCVRVGPRWTSLVVTYRLPDGREEDTSEVL